MIATCFILMSVNTGNMNMIADTQIVGKIIREDSVYYVMDFSDEAKERGFNNGFESRKVKKEDCVRIKNGN